MAIAPYPAQLPYSVSEYVNPRTKSISYRVQGSWQGKRLRVNKSTAAAAQAVCDFENAKTLRAAAATPPPRLVQTRLADDDLLALEATLAKAAARWGAAEILDAGLHALKAQPADVKLEPLVRAWLLRMKPDLGERWHKEIEKRTEYFFRGDNAELTARQFTPALFAGWLSRLTCGGQTKANYRNAISRWSADLKIEGVLAVNPCAGLRISRKSDRSQAPSVLTPTQAEALVAVHVAFADLAPQLGWVVECLFVGLRPQNEAPRALAKEIDLEAGEQLVMGSKRGVKPRRVTLHATAVEWLRLVKAAKRPHLAPYARHLRQRAVLRANEWLAQHAPKEKPIVWDEDILRHTFASMQAASGMDIARLAEMMGTSTRMIYAHYRHVRPAAEARAFWAITPPKIRRAIAGV